MSVIGCIFTFLGVTSVLCIGGVICESASLDGLFERIMKRVKR